MQYYLSLTIMANISQDKIRDVDLPNKKFR